MILFYGVKKMRSIFKIATYKYKNLLIICYFNSFYRICRELRDYFYRNKKKRVTLIIVINFIFLLIDTCSAQSHLNEADIKLFSKLIIPSYLFASNSSSIQGIDNLGPTRANLKINQYTGIYFNGPVQKVVATMGEYFESYGIWEENSERKLLYELSYDRAGHLVKKHEPSFHCDKGIDCNYFYNSKGQLIRTIDIGRDSDSFYNYDTYSFYSYDTFGHLLQIKSNSRKDVFAYDFKGRLVKYDYYSSSNDVDPIQTLKNEYDAKGNLIENNLYGFKSGDENLYDKNGNWLTLYLHISTAVWGLIEKKNYDPAGHLIEKIRYATDGLPNLKSTYTWGSGLNITETAYNVKRTLKTDSLPMRYDSKYYIYDEDDFDIKYYISDITTYHFDGEERSIITKRYRDNGVLVQIDTENYDSKGNLIKRIEEMQEIQDIYRGSQSKERKVYYYNYEFDIYGNWVKKISSREENNSKKEILLKSEYRIFDYYY